MENKSLTRDQVGSLQGSLRAILASAVDAIIIIRHDGGHSVGIEQRDNCIHAAWREAKAGLGASSNQVPRPGYRVECEVVTIACRYERAV